MQHSEIVTVADGKLVEIEAPAPGPDPHRPATMIARFTSSSTASK
jgi:hypothetical protein